MTNFSTYREVTFVKLSQSLFIPGQGFGDLGSTFPSATKRLKELKIYYKPELMSITIITNGKEVITPITNVVAMTLAPTKNNA